MKVSRTAAALGAAALFFSAVAQADRWDKLEERIQALESQNNGGLVAQELQQMEDELRNLRGRLEEQDYALQQLRVQQEKNAALEARLRTLEAGMVRQSSQSQPQPQQPSANWSQSQSAAGTSAPPGAEEQAQYQAALDMLKQGRYPEAIASFRRFREHAPNSSYSDNVCYWLGESLYMNKELPAALAEFDRLLMDFPQSNKRANAQLKMGFIYYDLNDFAKARTILEQVKADQVGTTAAELATQRLERMKSEGH